MQPGPDSSGTCRVLRTESGDGDRERKNLGDGGTEFLIINKFESEERHSTHHANRARGKLAHGEPC